ncbi:MAG: TniQ family protein [Nostoc sp. DedVER02]|uniref:TniQ family protein n=1 Tax=unclassified Nostoc TaxID=2593658 RepID=UPI002AD24624|nr:MULTISPECIES: TniQ family protein [unclassified Nostoc]MDZ7985180.1 TniQ family protein [Nostoc sp. DedVER02]MDZ8115118.1 TniQ family protein [Nostoc sp. DedVER01b]
MTAPDVKPWLFIIEPYPGESLSHFLGRFRRANHLSASGLGILAGIGAVVARWERFHFNPRPSQQELEAIASVVEVDAQRLAQMLPPAGVGMQHEPIRLCGACYAEAPCHQIEWQYKSVWKCDRHQFKLLAKCPNCEAPLKMPALWEDGRCHRCRRPFAEMAAYQKPVINLRSLNADS